MCSSDLWQPPSRLWKLAPWWGLALILVLSARQGAAIWLVLLPLLCALGLQTAFQPCENIVSRDELHLGAVAFGLAVVWVLSPCLARRSRWGSFLLVLATLGVGTLATWALWLAWLDAWSPGVLVVGHLVNSVCLAAALALAGLACRRRFGWLRFTLTTVLLGFLLGLGGVFGLTRLFGPGGPLTRMAWELLEAAAILTARNAEVVLPFLVLSFVSPFHRRRLLDLWQMGRGADPLAAASAEQPKPASSQGDTASGEAEAK